MAELPASWNLKTKKRDDGALDIVEHGKDGQDHVVRTTGKSGVAETDVAALAAQDHERVSTREWTRKQIALAEARKQQWADDMLDDFTDAAEPVAYAGLEVGRRRIGAFRVTRERWMRIFGGA